MLAVSAVVMGRRRSTRRRSSNPREGMVSKPGWGFLTFAMCATVGVGILAIVVMMIIAAMPDSSAKEVLQPPTAAEARRTTELVEESKRLMAASSIVQRCPELRGLARSLTKDRVFDVRELVVLEGVAARKGCPG